MLKSVLHDDEMIVYRDFTKQGEKKPCYCLVFSAPVSSDKTINSRIVHPIISKLLGGCGSGADAGKATVRPSIKKLLGKHANGSDLIDYVINQVIEVRDIKKENNIEEAVKSLLCGDTLFLLEGSSEILIIGTREWMLRSITEPESEAVVRGPREGFNESLNTNISLLTRRIVNPNLKFKYMELGDITKTRICISYIEGIASEKIIREVEKRLNGIQSDGILDSGYIQELIKDAPYSVFQTIGNTERPDVVAAKLLEGRVAILCDGSPSALTVPFLFIEYFLTNEDYYADYIFASINRILRFVCYFFTISIPAIYVAIVSFHQELLPTPLLLSIAIARHSVPFPSVVELIVMLLGFEVMREAGVRLPSMVGMTISIVGALVLGQAAVSAKIISAPIVIITAFTGICSFVIFRLKGPVIVTRIYFLIAASFLGLVGYMLGIITLFLYLVSVRSFGVPYMLNASLIDVNSIQDTAIRAPLWFMTKRPRFAINHKKGNAARRTK